ncbi:MAG: RimK family alpha-L-glutamate ligase [Patescibacteria group bacterium]|jgi:ribosomal protein S6--L-glutamate ligase
MKIGILTFGRPKTLEVEPPFETNRLFETAMARGHEAKIFCEPFFSFRQNNGRLEIFYDNQPLPPIDIFIARTNFIEDQSFHSITIDALISAGFKVTNSQNLILSAAKNKFARKLLINKAGLPTPKSTIVRDVSTIATEAEAIGFPLVAKTPSGSGGRGVFLAENLATLLPIVDYLTVNHKMPLLLEEFIKEAEGKDLRIFVAGDKILAAMERSAKPGEVRANIHAGGAGHPVELSDEEKKIAVAAAKAVGLDIAGVDIIRSSRGPLVLEVNARPGFEGLEEATGIDVAGGIIDYICTS